MPLQKPVFSRVVPGLNGTGNNLKLLTILCDQEPNGEPLPRRELLMPHERERLLAIPRQEPEPNSSNSPPQWPLDTRANPASWKHANLYRAYSFLDIGDGVDLQELVNLLEASCDTGPATPD